MAPSPTLLMSPLTMTWELRQPTLVRLGSILTVMRYKCVWMMMEWTPLECGVVRSQDVSVSYQQGCMYRYCNPNIHVFGHMQLTYHSHHLIVSLFLPTLQYPRTSSLFPYGTQVIYSNNNCIVRRYHMFCSH